MMFLSCMFLLGGEGSSLRFCSVYHIFAIPSMGFEDFYAKMVKLFVRNKTTKSAITASVKIAGVYSRIGSCDLVMFSQKTFT